MVGPLRSHSQRSSGCVGGCRHDAFNNILYLAYPTPPNGDVMIVTTGGADWAPPYDLYPANRAQAGASPVLVEFGGVLYLFFKGTGTSNIYYCCPNGTQWSSCANLKNKNGASTSSAPSVTVYNGWLWVAFKDDNGSKHLLLHHLPRRELVDMHQSDLD